MKRRKGRSIISLFVIWMGVGCAASGGGQLTVLTQEDIADIRKLAVVTVLRDERLQVLRRTPVPGTSPIRAVPYYGPYVSSGDIGTDIAVVALVGLLQAFVEIGLSERSEGPEKIVSLGGEEDSLRQALSDFDVKKVFDETFSDGFSVNFEVITPGEADRLGIDEYREVQSTSGARIRDYGPLREKLGADAVLQIDFIYGLAAYEGSMTATAVVSALVSVVNVQKNELVMRHLIAAESGYKGMGGYTLKQFAAEDGKLFKKELRKALRTFTRLVASKFGE